MANFTATFLTLAFFMAGNLAVPNLELSMKLSDECKGKGFCSIKPEGYDEMMKMVEKLLTPTFLAQNIGNRIGGGTKPTERKQKKKNSPKNDWHNCPYRTETEETPYAYKHSHDSDVDYIVQHDFLSQPIEMVTCAHDQINSTNTDGECFTDLGLKSFNLKSSCKTSTYKHYLIVFNPRTKKLEKKPFDVNCCCTCHLSRIGPA